MGSIDNYRFITEEKTFAINLLTGEITENPKILRRIKKAGHYSLEWRGALEKNRQLVDKILKEVDFKIKNTALTYTFDRDRIDDTAQEIRLMVTDIVLKNLHRNYEDLLEFVRSCINNFARRVFSSITSEQKKSPDHLAYRIDQIPQLSSHIPYNDVQGTGRNGNIVNIHDYDILSEHLYDPILDLNWKELKDQVRYYLTKKQTRVFNLIVEEPNLTEAEMAQILGYADQSGVSHILRRIRRKLQALLDSGKIVLH